MRARKVVRFALNGSFRKRRQSQAASIGASHFIRLSWIYFSIDGTWDTQNKSIANSIALTRKKTDTPGNNLHKCLLKNEIYYCLLPSIQILQSVLLEAAHL